jgi:hypothetical protein
MNKIAVLIVGGFAVILILPFFNTFWGQLGQTLIDTFGITPTSPTGVTFYVWYKAMPYIAIGAIVILAFKIIRGRHNNDDSV